MACGIPVIASISDGSREAVRDGVLGNLVDPDNPSELIATIIETLNVPTRTVPEGLQYFSFEAFKARLQDITRNIVSKP